MKPRVAMCALRTFLVASVCLVQLVPVLSARADAITPFQGECPPGLERGIAGHAEACVPSVCQTDSQCSGDSRCVTLWTCRAPREFRGNGRVEFPQPVTQVVEIGFCRADHTCAEGRCESRKQCEPNDPTPAFDRRLHTWTGQAHPASSCASCTVTPAASRMRAPAWIVLGIAAIGASLRLLRRRRSP